jgi:hypothetical protein
MNTPETEIEKIITRNKRVETDKKWETSLFRRLFLTVTTFVLAFLFLKIIKVDNAFWGACVPAGAYFLQNLVGSLTPLRKIWEKNR